MSQGLPPAGLVLLSQCPGCSGQGLPQLRLIWRLPSQAAEGSSRVGPTRAFPWRPGSPTCFGAAHRRASFPGEPCEPRPPAASARLAAERQGHGYSPGPQSAVLTGLTTECCREKSKGPESK